MQKNFLVSYSLLSEGRPWVLLFSVFSHISFLHLLLNMLVLNNFGPILVRVLGARFFLGFYLVAGCVASVAHAFVSKFLLHSPDLPALGASGAIAGLILIFSLLFPREKILLLGLLPLPAIFGALVFVGLDIWGLVAQAEGGGLPIGHGAHLGGALVGVLGFWIFRRNSRIQAIKNSHLSRERF